MNHMNCGGITPGKILVRHTPDFGQINDVARLRGNVGSRKSCNSVSGLASAAMPSPKVKVLRLPELTTLCTHEAEQNAALTFVKTDCGKAACCDQHRVNAHRNNLRRRAQAEEFGARQLFDSWKQEEGLYFPPFLSKEI